MSLSTDANNSYQTRLDRINAHIYCSALEWMGKHGEEGVYVKPENHVFLFGVSAQIACRIGPYPPCGGNNNGGKNKW